MVQSDNSERIVLNTYIDSVAGGKIAGDYLLCNESFKTALDESSERTCAEIRVVAALDDVVLSLIGNIDVQVFVIETLLEVGEHEVDYLHDIVLCERLVEDYLIETVEEFRTELLLQQ